MKALRVRHESAPPPMGCRWCGTPEREHGQQPVPGKGLHGWVEPTRAQIAARLPSNIARNKTTPTPTEP